MAGKSTPRQPRLSAPPTDHQALPAEVPFKALGCLPPACSNSMEAIISNTKRAMTTATCGSNRMEWQVIWAARHLTSRNLLIGEETSSIRGYTLFGVRLSEELMVICLSPLRLLGHEYASGLGARQPCSPSLPSLISTIPRHGHGLCTGRIADHKFPKAATC